jgi:hypothetical protein
LITDRSLRYGVRNDWSVGHTWYNIRVLSPKFDDFLIFLRCCTDANRSPQISLKFSSMGMADINRDNIR